MSDHGAQDHEAAVEALARIYPDLDRQAARTLYELVATFAALKGFLAPFVEQHRLSFGSLNILVVLRRSPDGTAPMPEVGRQLLVTRQNVSALVAGLVRRRLVERLRSRADARVRLLRITARGRRLTDGFLPDHYRRISSIFSALRGPELELLRDYLRRIRAAVPEIASRNFRQAFDDRPGRLSRVE
ncbi:MAG TPA: MarR family winged helix-turn-helix transcriptional regulator [Candidatus Acidoferrum sp.]|nr:MarR family winged helix-turn-helix transcriptional regulator [Candidatus Acidoferrum sp.]